ncbi:MAG: amidohydrolase family protein [Acidobacteria bacterium]|nr:amidohydrolase family protein [Acidobacteriota bacterium]MCZ6769993.1 amidohydrolase family protein [Acidobacteriota bacterium]
MFANRTPFWFIEKLVTRKEENGRVWNQAEAITREQARYMSTNWASYDTADEEILGTIEPGKLADFAIIDKNFLTVPEDEMGELKVLMTLAEGKALY